MKAAQGPRFTKVLVANRGEIAVRVIRGAKKLGYKTVAVYSDADQDALHVREADESVRIGPAPAKESYLVIDKIIAAAKTSGAQAIHPGYGFLSENANFSQACKDAGLIFIGPDAESIAAMGSKSAAKERMLKAGVPCVPGYQGADQSDDTLVKQAKKVGLPVMIKAAAGGGGRGMRLVHDEAKLEESIKSARSESANAFGSGELLIEKAVVDGRHVEIQVFGDRHGNVIFLGERDCSIQRRNQKVVEEAPSPAVDERLRLAMGKAAVAAAKAVNYVGAGTVEFLLGRDDSRHPREGGDPVLRDAGASPSTRRPGESRDPASFDWKFYFLEMNTRLQVEHPVTELVYGVDLVEWQLRVAQGEKLPLNQEEVLARRNGHAIEVRLCAEDPSQNYLPQTGTVLRWRAPHGPGVRVDTYLHDGVVISPYYDSMQAKIIAWGEDREVARTRLVHALADTVLLGVTSNRDYLGAVLRTDAFASGDFSTGFVPQYFPQDKLQDDKPSATEILIAAAGLYLLDAAALRKAHKLPAEFIGWHNSHESPTDFKLQWRDQEYDIEVAVHEGRVFTLTSGLGAESRHPREGGDPVLLENRHAREGGHPVLLEVTQTHDGDFTYIANGVQGRAFISRQGDTVWLSASNSIRRYIDLTLAPAEAAEAGSDGRILAHSDGKIVVVNVKPGDNVVRGNTLVVLEAMKMEFQLTSPVDGKVEAVSVKAGDQVKGRQLLVQVTPA